MPATAKKKSTKQAHSAATKTAKQPEDKYAKAFRATPDAAVISALDDGRILEVNAGFTKQSGWSASDAVGRTSLELGLWPDSRERQRMVDALRRDHRLRDLPIRVRTRDGAFRDCEISGELLELDGKSCIISVTRDITARRRALEMLDYRSRFERLIAEISSRFIGPSPQDLDELIEGALRDIARFVRADSASLFHLFDDGRKVSLTHLWRTEEVHLERSKFQDVELSSLPTWSSRIENNEVVVVPDVDKLGDEYALLRDIFRQQGVGSVVDVPMVYEGRPIGFLGLSTCKPDRPWTDDEISLLRLVGQVFASALQRRTDVRALEESEARLQSIIDNSPALIYMKDLDDRYLLANRGFAKMLGKTQAQITGSTTPDLLPPDVVESCLVTDRQVLESGEAMQFEESAPGPDGLLTYLSVKFPLVDAHGEMYAIGGISTDITTRNKLTDALRSLVEASSVEGGQAYFDTLVSNLTRLLGTKTAWVAEKGPDQPPAMQTLSAWIDGGLVDNFAYELKGTPCEEVFSGKNCFYNEGVASLFPGDPHLAEMGLESYLGTPLLSPDGDPIGLLVAVDTKPLSQPDLAQDIIRIFAARAGAELARQRAEDALTRRDAILRAVSKAAESFLRSSTWDEHIQDILRHLGLATGASRVYIREIEGTGEAMTASLLHEWCDEGIPSVSESADCAVFDMGHPARTDIREALNNGDILHGPRGHLLPGKGSDITDDIPHLHSMIIVPVLTGGTLWGMFVLHFPTMRLITEAELEAIKAAAETLGAAIERLRVQTALSHSDAVLHAVTLATTRLLRTPEWKDCVDEILAAIGSAAGASRSFLSNFYHDDADVLRLTKTHEWCAEGVPPLKNLPSMNHLDVKAAGFGPMVDALGSGQTLVVNTETLLGEERAFFEHLDSEIVTFVAAPVFVDDRLWGTIGLEHRHRKGWKGMERDALRAAADAIGSAVKRLEIERARKESEMRFERLSRATFEGVFIHEQGRIIDANDSFCALTGFPLDELVGTEAMRFIVPEDRTRVGALIRDGGDESHEAMGQRSDGTLVPLEFRARTLQYDGKPRRIVAVRDISERRQAEAALDRRDRILQAVRFAAARFLESASWQEHIPGVLRRLGEAARVSRVYIFHHEPAAHGGSISRLTHEWVADGIRPTYRDRGRQQLNLREQGLMRFEETLGSGEVMYGHTDNLAPEERRIFDEQDVVSFALAPIITDDRWWGTIGCDECQAGREWTSAEIDALKAAADTLAAAIANATAFRKISELRRQLELENEYLREQAGEEQAFGDIVGRSTAMQKLFTQIDLVAPTESTVLIQGESGTGKELIARAIHGRSKRHSRALIKVNCASIPRELFESEFFGHVRGSFTGAIKDRAGRFELADGGTLFLDEVGEIPVELQSKLLRVLQEGEFERVGEERTRRVDVRVIAASNRDLEVDVEAGRFRRDLYFRLSVFPVQVVPLKERPDDIPLLAEHFLEQSSRRLGVSLPRFKQKHVIQLQAYDWPGNIRELQNVIERAVIRSQQGYIQLDLPERTGDPRIALSPGPVTPARIRTEREMRDAERDNLIAALDGAGWKIYGSDGAAQILGLPPSTLASRMRVLSIRRPGR